MQASQAVHAGEPQTGAPQKNNVTHDPVVEAWAGAGARNRFVFCRMVGRKASRLPLLASHRPVCRGFESGGMRCAFPPCIGMLLRYCVQLASQAGTAERGIGRAIR